MNLFPVISKKLGLALEENFKIEGEGDILFCFTHDGLFIHLVGNDKLLLVPCKFLTDVLTGKKKIILNYFIPKEGETYFYVQWAGNKLTVEPSEYHEDDSFHAKQLYCRNMFRTREEAEAQKFNMYKKITGKSFLS